MNRTILVADTDSVLLEILRTRFRALGLSVKTADRGDDAVELIRQADPRIACIQHDLRCSDGRTVCERLADDPPHGPLKLVMMCDRPGNTFDAACRKLGAYVTTRTGNVWHRLEPLIHELIEESHRDASVSTGTATGSGLRVREWSDECARATRPPRDLRIDEPARQASRQRDAGRVSPTGTAVAASRDARENVLDAVFAWFGRARETAPAPEPASASLSGPHRRGSAEPPWVLCVEDDADFSLALKLRLEAHGVAVVRAFDGRAGYRAAFTHPASAILLDYNLPQGQGDYVLRRLKENPVTANVPVIVLTGIRSAATRRQMLALGADAYLTKPLDFDELIDALSEHIDVLPREFASASY